MVSAGRGSTVTGRLGEHPIAPRHLAAPLHRHSREDEYSFVLEGKLGALLVRARLIRVVESRA